MLLCERCGARMHGTRGSRPPVRRYLCSSRRHGQGCGQPITKAAPLEEHSSRIGCARSSQTQTCESAFLTPSPPTRTSKATEQTVALSWLTSSAACKTCTCLEISPKRSTSCGRQTIQDELERLAPPADPQLTEAEELLANFASFWDREDSPAERHRLLTTLFENVWQDEGRIVFVRPRPTFIP